LKPDLTATDGDGNTAVHIAVMKGKLDVLEELVKVSE